MIPLKIAKKKDQEMIDQIISLLKEHPIVKKMFSKYGINIDKIHDIPISFKELDVSAKAKGGEIFLNENLLEEEEGFLSNIGYIVHELTHVLQQITGNIIDNKCLKEVHYLDDPSEVEAFQNQIAFIAAYKDKSEADSYVKDLLDFHDFSGKERTKKETELKSKYEHLYN